MPWHYIRERHVQFVRMTYTGYEVLYMRTIRTIFWILCFFGHRHRCCTAFSFGWPNKCQEEKKVTKQSGTITLGLAADVFSFYNIVRYPTPLYSYRIPYISLSHTVSSIPHNYRVPRPYRIPHPTPIPCTVSRTTGYIVSRRVPPPTPIPHPTTTPCAASHTTR